MPPGYSDVRKAAFDAALAALPDPSAAAEAAYEAAEAFLAALAAPLNLSAALAGLACAKGCWWCCCQIVGVTRAELVRVEDAIKALPKTEQDAVRRRAKSAWAKGRGLDQAGWWRARIACPLLGEDRLCTVHAARPLACRAHNSADAEACRRSFHGEAVQTPTLAAQRGVMAHAQMGLAEAMAQAGEPPALINLAEGLAARLTSPTAP